MAMVMPITCRGPRRADDPPALLADVSRIGALLSWKPKYDLDEFVCCAVEAAGMAPEK